MTSNHHPSDQQAHDAQVRNADEGGKPSCNLVQHVHSLFKKLKGDTEEFYSKLYILESSIVTGDEKASPMFIEVEQHPSSEKGRLLKIDVVTLLGELPAHMMHMLARVDTGTGHTRPSSRHACDPTSRDGDFGDAHTGANCNALQELHRCAELCNLLSIIVANGPELKKGPPAGLDWVVLQARAVACSRGLSPDTGMQPLLTSIMELLNVFLCKSLGSSSAGALHSMLGSESAKIFDRGVEWMRVAVHLFHCIDRVAFLTSVVRRKPGRAEELHHESHSLAMEAIAAARPLMQPLLIRMFRYLRTCFEIVREKVVSDLAVEPRDARAEARLVGATNGTRAVAYQLAMAHEVVERWVQAAPMHALIRQPRALPAGAENKAPPAPQSDGDDSAVDLTTDCIAHAVLEMAFAGVALMLPEADAKGRRIYSLAYEDPPPADSRDPGTVVPTSVVDGDVELLVSRALLVFYMATSALRPLLTAAVVGDDWESCLGSWYLPFTACAYCAMSIVEDVMQRRWAVTFGEPPRPRQEHEGQLTINALRATAMLLATHGNIFCDPSPPEIFDKLHDAYQGLLSATRTALLTPPETVASAFGAGTIAQDLFADRGAVNIAPVDCYDPETGALVCLAGTNLAEVLREEIAAADLIETASGRRRSAAARARVADAQLPALLQAKEVSLRVWQIIWSVVAFSMQGPGGKPLQDGLSQSALAQVLKASVERAMCARPAPEVWQQLPARMLTNIKAIASSASTTEMQARGGRGGSRVQQEHRDVVTFVLRFFQALREKIDKEPLVARLAGATAAGAFPGSAAFPGAPPSTAFPGGAAAAPFPGGPTGMMAPGASGLGYMHGGYPYPAMFPPGDPRAMLYEGMQRAGMHAQPRMSGGAVGLPHGGRIDLWQGRAPAGDRDPGVARDREARPQGRDGRAAEARSRSREAGVLEARRSAAARADGETHAAPPAASVQHSSRFSSEGRSEESSRGGPTEAVAREREREPDREREREREREVEREKPRRLSTGADRDPRQGADHRTPFVFASSYPDLMAPQATANPMFMQPPQGYFMAPMNQAAMNPAAMNPAALNAALNPAAMNPAAALALDPTTGMPLAPAYLNAVGHHPMMHSGPLMALTQQDPAMLGQLSRGAPPALLPAMQRKPSCDVSGEDEQNQHRNM